MQPEPPHRLPAIFVAVVAQKMDTVLLETEETGGEHVGAVTSGCKVWARMAVGSAAVELRVGPADVIS